MFDAETYDKTLADFYVTQIPPRANAAGVAKVLRDTRVWIAKGSYDALMTVGRGFAGSRSVVEGPLADGRMEAAVECFERAADARPEAFDPCMEAGRVYASLAKSASALRWFEKAIAREPCEAALIHAANAWARLGRPKDGLGHCDRLLAMEPANPIGLRVRAELLRRADMFDEALATLDLLKSADGDADSVDEKRALVLEGAGRPDLALPIRERLRGDGMWSWLSYAKVLSALGRHDDALSAISEAGKRARTKAYVVKHQHRALVDAGRTDAAEAFAVRSCKRILSALQRDKLPGSWDDALDLLSALGRNDEAIELTDRVLDKVRRAARDRGLVHQRAQLLSRKPDRLGEAADWFVRAAQIEEELRVGWWDSAVTRAASWYEAGRAFRSIGNVESALTAFAAGRDVLGDERYACHAQLAECSARCADPLDDAASEHWSRAALSIDVLSYKDVLTWA